MLAALRQFLDGRGYLEVETPMMHPVAGGAMARPFTTHHNALDLDLYLRIAPELYLKRLVVGGLERVYEINRNFRNEGISTRHNPEFTMLEFYQAYSDYQDLMTMTEEMVAFVATSAAGKEEVEYEGDTISFRAPFARLSLRRSVIDAATKKLGTAVTDADLRDANTARQLASRLGIHVDAKDGPGKITTTIFETLVEESLVQPTFVYDFPTEVSPLSKQRADDPDTVERFELYAGKMELANAFSELNDPAGTAQALRAAAAREGQRRSGGARHGRRLRARARVRPAAHRGRRRGRRSPRDAPDRQQIDQGRHPVPAHAPDKQAGLDSNFRPEPEPRAS